MLGTSHSLLTGRGLAVVGGVNQSDQDLVGLVLVRGVAGLLVGLIGTRERLGAAGVRLAEAGGVKMSGVAILLRGSSILGGAVGVEDRRGSPFKQFHKGLRPKWIEMGFGFFKGL